MLLGDEQAAGEPGFGRLAAAHSAMLRAYRAQDWDQADAALAAGLAEYEAYGLGVLHALFAKRIATLRDQSPGAAWDGVFQASEK